MDKTQESERLSVSAERRVLQRIAYWRKRGDIASAQATASAPPGKKITRNGINIQARNKPHALERPSVSAKHLVLQRIAYWRKRSDIAGAEAEADALAGSKITRNGIIVVSCAIVAAVWLRHYTNWGGDLKEFLGDVLIVAAFGLFFASRQKFIKTAQQSPLWAGVLPLTAIAYLLSLFWATLEVKVSPPLPTQELELKQKGSSDTPDVEVLPKEGSTKLRLSLIGGRTYVASMKETGHTDVTLNPFAVEEFVVPRELMLLQVRIKPTEVIKATARARGSAWRLRVMRNGRRIAEVHPYNGVVIICGADAEHGCGDVRLQEHDRIETFIEFRVPGGWKEYSKLAEPYVMTSDPKPQEITIDDP